MSKSPIWAVAAPGARKPRFSREQMAQVALAIADADGFEALSMRRVADGLGAGRSEERRVGKECSLLCRSRWSPYH